MTIKRDGWTLRHGPKGGPRTAVSVGDSVTCFCGEPCTVTGGTPPHKEGSTGYITVTQPDQDREDRFYPAVFNCIWVEDGQ